jgi:acylphosphatase
MLGKFAFAGKPEPFSPATSRASQLSSRFEESIVTETSPIRAEVHYSGRVQGVGFRFNAQRIAQSFAVTGFVQNLPDGEVRLVAEGDGAEIERFLSRIAQSMGSNIAHAARVDHAASGRFAGFEIRV